MKKVFLESLNISILKKIESLSEEEVKNMDIIDDDTGSFMVTNYIRQNNFLYIAKEFNIIGKVN
jgi:hypothetical protein